MIDLTEEIKDILDIEVEELKESLSCSGVIDFVEILTGCVARKSAAWAKLVNIFKTTRYQSHRKYLFIN